ncbi:MAG: ATP-binding cassette domain-containing protein [Planctomycetes bacterium]|nr:ATP-binding cassette domain-containing protein [Planctomycetota bacterium]
MIELRGVHKQFDGPDGRPVDAVRGVDLHVADGETVCLIGTSGCGKTTTMKLINRLIEPTAGSVHVGGADVRTLDSIRLRRRIGYVIQSGGLFPHLTIARNVGVLCELEGWTRAKTRARVEELLDLVNLPAAEFADRRPGELSGGQRQRVGVARALALDPDYVLMDEPFGALDPLTRADLQREFHLLQERVRKTVVLVTHDTREAFALGDRVALMDRGRIVQIGTLDDFRERPASRFVARFLDSHLGGDDGGGEP